MNLFSWRILYKTGFSMKIILLRGRCWLCINKYHDAKGSNKMQQETFMLLTIEIISNCMIKQLCKVILTHYICRCHCGTTFQPFKVDQTWKPMPCRSVLLLLKCYCNRILNVVPYSLPLSLCKLGRGLSEMFTHIMFLAQTQVPFIWLLPW